MLMQTSERLSTRSAAGFPLSPAMMMPNPKNSAMTMTWSIVALASGCTALEGKMDTMVSMKGLPRRGLIAQPAGLQQGEPVHPLGYAGQDQG